MLKKVFTGALLCLIVSTVSGFSIVRDGRAEATIVIPAEANSVERYAAQELQYIIRKATGAELPVVSGPVSGSRILIGRAAGAGAFEPGRYMVKTEGDTLLLAGQDSETDVARLGTASGSLYAVYKWAEDQMKVYWLWPDEKGEVIPKRKDVESGDHDLTVRSKLQFARVRRWNWKWSRRMLRADNSRPLLGAGHAFTDWADRYWETHPEYFAMNKEGKRFNKGKYSSMCVSNPAFHQQIVENWKASGKTDSAVNAKENDTLGECQCPTCLSWDVETDRRWPTGLYAKNPNVGERYARYFLSVWELARQVNPDAKVEGYAYENYIYAPVKTKLNPSIIIGFVDDLHFPRTPEMQEMVDHELRKWHESGATLYLRPNVFLQSYVAPQLFFRQYAEQFRLAMECGVIGLDVDGPNNSFGTVGVNLYVLARLVAAPEKSVEDCLAEYCSGFGKAAPAIRKYIDYWEKYTMDHAEDIYLTYMEKTTAQFFNFGWDDPILVHYMYPLSSFDPAEQILDEAMALAKDDPEAEDRVRFLYQGLVHAKLCVRASAVFADDRSPNKARRAVLEEIRDLRKILYPCVADVAYFEDTQRNEGKNWKFRGFDLEDALALPERWQAMIGKEEVEAAFESGAFAAGKSVSTWKFLEDQGVSDYKFAWCRTTFTIPEKERGQNVILHLGAVDESCVCKVNGQIVGRLVFDAKANPESWKTPLEFDVTKYIDPKGENTIDLLVINAAGKGGLWKRSYIRFEQPGTGEIFRPAAFECRVEGALSQRKEGDSDVWSLTSQGKAGERIQALTPVRIAGLAGKTVRLKATVRTLKLTQGEFQVVVRQVDRGGQSLSYDGFTFKRSGGWGQYAETVKIREDAAGVYVYLRALNMNRGAVGEVKDISVEPLK